MTSGREGVCEYDIFFTKLSHFDQYASNFLALMMDAAGVWWCDGGQIH